MKTCPNCGKKCLDDKEYCYNCGAHLTNASNNSVTNNSVTNKYLRINNMIKSQYPISDEECDAAEKSFRFYVMLPKILLFVMLGLFFLGGIIMAISLKSALYLLIGWVGGGILAVVTYWILKIVFSYKILTVKYLKSIKTSVEIINEENKQK